MVNIGIRLSVAVLSLFMTSLAFSQVESGRSYMEAFIANGSAIQNYDVGYRHWVGYYVPEHKDRPASDEANKIDGAEYLAIGRIVVDRKSNWVFLVREIQSSLSGKQKTTLECLCWRNGMESVISTQFTVISRPCTFERFCKPHQIPILERTTSEPLKLVTDSIVADNDKTLRMYDASTAVYHPDGSTTVSTRSRQGSFLAKMTFDPVTSMPIHWTAGNCDRDSNSLDEVHYNAHPRFEKHKELYRIVSTEYNNPSPIGKISDAKSLGNCQFKWYQFNEDSIAFPNEKGTAFDLEEASEFLKATKLELTK